MVPPAPNRVARRAMILYTLIMRFTFETNSNHPWAKGWTEFLPHWLDDLDLRSEVEPRDVEILTTPLGELDREQQTDARWCGEATGVLGWALNASPPRRTSTLLTRINCSIPLGLAQRKWCRLLAISSPGHHSGRRTNSSPTTQRSA